MTLTHAEFDRLSGILHQLASQSGITPDEIHALRTATHALFFAISKHQSEFDAFLTEIESPVTPEEKAKLKDMGLKTD